MGNRRLIDSTTKVFSDYKMTQYINNQYNEQYQNVPAAIAGLTLSVVGTALTSGMAPVIAGALSVGIGFSDLLEAVKQSFGDSSLNNTVNNLTKGDRLEVTTNYYEWSSGSGNHYTHVTETSYRII